MGIKTYKRLRRDVEFRHQRLFRVDFDAISSGKVPLRRIPQDRRPNHHGRITSRHVAGARRIYRISYFKRDKDVSRQR